MAGEAAISCLDSAFAMAAARSGSASCAVIVRRGAARRVHPPDMPKQLIRGHVEAKLRDDGVEDRSRRRNRCIGRRQTLRGEQLAVIGVHRRERLADDQRGLRLVDLRLLAADRERRAGGQENAHDQERKPCPDDGDLASEIHGVSLSLPRSCGALRATAATTATSGTTRRIIWPPRRGRQPDDPPMADLRQSGRSVPVARPAAVARASAIGADIGRMRGSVVATTTLDHEALAR